MNTLKTKSLSLPSWKNLSLREQVSQTLIMHACRETKGLPFDDIGLKQFLEKYPIGAAFVGGEVIEDGTNTLEWTSERTAQLRKFSKTPIIIAADLENGCGDVIPGLTALPFPMALGASNDPTIAYEYGKCTANEGALAGINWNFAPMGDLNLHPLSSNVGTRAFGDKAEHIIPLVQAYAEGLRDQGMADCIKTFPGDGSDYRDQHITTTTNNLSVSDWKKSYGKVFQDLIDSGNGT